MTFHCLARSQYNVLFSSKEQNMFSSKEPTQCFILQQGAKHVPLCSLRSTRCQIKYITLSHKLNPKHSSLLKEHTSI